ncbi:hypothetical protein AXF42_Ash009996 [Apostasia shenzhenica]|uniref:50S ribosomal protein L18, chloroplastic n=1 Tax=Apostasia shenzhenica TaxID=1088818 RepID=A0A2I0ACL9_9ASPA|nr:hypothetical protein AXF42_Ash009996 [Apostasia shenzhenica]
MTIFALSATCPSSSTRHCSCPVMLCSSLKLTSKPSSLSWTSSIPIVPVASFTLDGMLPPLGINQQVGVIQSAWTRRSKSEAAKRPNRKSWKQRTDMYMRPFLLNVFFSKRFIHAKVVHRGTSKVVSVASTNAKDLRNTLPSLTDYDACRTIGQLIAERSMDADIFAMSYEPKKNERIEGKLGIVLDTIKENGIIFV